MDEDTKDRTFDELMELAERQWSEGDHAGAADTLAKANGCVPARRRSGSAEDA